MCERECLGEMVHIWFACGYMTEIEGIDGPGPLCRQEAMVAGDTEMVSARRDQRWTR